MPVEQPVPPPAAVTSVTYAAILSRGVYAVVALGIRTCWPPVPAGPLTSPPRSTCSPASCTRSCARWPRPACCAPTAAQLPTEVAAGNATPVGRSATAAEVAVGIAFLAAPGASYVTGTTLVIDGGNSITAVKSAD